MGHVEPGGPVAAPVKQRRRLTPVWRQGQAPHPVWDLWWALKKRFSLAGAPASWFGTPGAWTYFGNDFVTGLRRNGSTQDAFDLMDARPDLVEPVRDLALLNMKRQEQMFQFIALLYVSVPVTLVLGMAQLMPQALIRLATEQRTGTMILVGALTVGALFYLVGMWRARQLVSVIELWRIERGPLKPAQPSRRAASGAK